MPCYLFTFHGYGTQLPDSSSGYVSRDFVRPRGYVQCREGLLAPDANMATYYRRNLLHDPVSFSHLMQEQMLAAAIEAFRFQELRGHYIATESTHIHLLVSWRSNAAWQLVRRRLANSLTRRLDREFERRPWFAKQPSRKQVRDRRHFDYLMTTYMPKLSGLKWREGQGVLGD